MRGRKHEKKSIEELEVELAEFIANSGRTEQDIHTDYKDYRTLKKRFDTPGSYLNDNDIRRMKELYDPYLLGMTIYNKQNKIRSARKAAAAAATTTATSNVANNSISSSATSVDSSTSTSINVNEITASFDSTPPSSDLSSTTSPPSSNDESRVSLDINSLSDHSSILASRSINETGAVVDLSNECSIWSPHQRL